LVTSHVFCIHMGMSKMTTLVTVKLPRNAWHKKTGRVSKNPKFLYPASFTPSPVALDTAWKEHPSSSAASKAYRSMKHVQTSLHCEVVCGHINIVDVNIYHIATDLWNSMNIDSDIKKKKQQINAYNLMQLLHIPAAPARIWYGRYAIARLR